MHLFKKFKFFNLRRRKTLLNTPPKKYFLSFWGKFERGLLPFQLMGDPSQKTFGMTNYMSVLRGLVHPFDNSYEKIIHRE
jgi:hypothetical protein